MLEPYFPSMRKVCLNRCIFTMTFNVSWEDLRIDRLPMPESNKKFLVYILKNGQHFRKILSHKDALNIMFGKFKNDIDDIIDDTNNMIIDVEEIGDDF